MTPMALLESGIPLSLLLDLLCGPQSADLLRQEKQGLEAGLERCSQAGRDGPGAELAPV